MESSAVLFGACLEAFQAEGAANPPPDEEEFPGLDWEGWRRIAETLGIFDTTDAPVFRARQAVKIAVKADSANLGGRLVKFDAVEARLTEILSGGATLSQIPDTQAEEAALRPARAVIVLRESRRRPGGRRSNPFYEVLFRNDPLEEGTWLSFGQLQRHFPDSWREMIEDFNKRVASGRVLEPSPAEEAAAQEGGEEEEQEEGGQQRQGTQQRQQAGASGAGPSGRQADSLGGQAAAARLPVGPSNIPLESQPDDRQAFYDQRQGPPPSLLLAGFNVHHQPAPRRQQSASRSVQQQQQYAAPAASPAPRPRPSVPLPHPAQQQQQQQQQGRPLTCSGPPPLPPGSYGPPPQQPLPRQPLQQGGSPPHGSGLRAERHPGGDQGLLHDGGRRRGPKPPPGYVRRVESFGVPPAAAALSPARLPAGRHPAPSPGRAPNPFASPGATASRQAPGGAAVPGSAKRPAAEPAASEPPARRRGPRPPPDYVPPAALARTAAKLGVIPPQQQPALPAAQRGEQAASGGAAAQPAPVGQQPASPAAAGGKRGAQEGPAAAPAAAGHEEQRAAKRGKRQQAAAEPVTSPRPPGIMAAAAAVVAEVVHAATAALQMAPRITSPTRARAGQPAAAAEQPRQQAAQPAAQPALQQAAQPTAGWEEPPDAADLAFQRGLAVMAAQWENKAPSPSKLGPEGELLPPAAAAAGAPPPVNLVAAAVDATPGDDEFFDAAEELQEGGSQAAEGSARRQRQQRRQQVTAPEAPPADGCLLPASLIDLRTQPDDFQWTNLQDSQRDDLPLPTQALQGGGARAQEEAAVVVPDTEEQADAAAQQQRQQQQQAAGTSGQQVGAPRGGRRSQRLASGAAERAAEEEEEAEAAVEEEEGGEGELGDDTWVERFVASTIRGAKNEHHGVELWVEWPDGERTKEATARIHRLARHDCLGCQSLMKLTQFLESKTRSRPKKAG